MDRVGVLHSWFWSLLRGKVPQLLSGKQSISCSWGKWSHPAGRRILSEMFHPEECQLTCSSEACSDLFWDLGVLNAGRIRTWVGSQPVEREVLLCSSSDYQSWTLTCCFRKAGTVKPDRNPPFSGACCWGFNSETLWQVCTHLNCCRLVFCLFAWPALEMCVFLLLSQSKEVIRAFLIALVCVHWSVWRNKGTLKRNWTPFGV